MQTLRTVKKPGSQRRKVLPVAGKRSANRRERAALLRGEVSVGLWPDHTSPTGLRNPCLKDEGLNGGTGSQP